MAGHDVVSVNEVSKGNEECTCECYDGNCGREDEDNSEYSNSLCVEIPILETILCLSPPTKLIIHELSLIVSQPWREPVHEEVTQPYYVERATETTQLHYECNEEEA